MCDFPINQANNLIKTAKGVSSSFSIEKWRLPNLESSRERELINVYCEIVPHRPNSAAFTTHSARRMQSGKKQQQDKRWLKRKRCTTKLFGFLKHYKVTLSFKSCKVKNLSFPFHQHVVYFFIIWVIWLV